MQRSVMDSAVLSCGSKIFLWDIMDSLKTSKNGIKQEYECEAGESQPNA